MSTKTTNPKDTLFRYEPEELKPHDIAADETLVDEFITRNRNAINKGLKAARQFDQGRTRQAIPFSPRALPQR